MGVSLLDLFGGVYKNKKVLVTGDTGFKGSWLSIWLNMMGAEVFGFSLPPKTKQDNYVTTNLEKVISHTDGDIRELSTIKNYIQKVQPHFIFHLAAQALVLDSYEEPHNTFETNLMGTVNILEAARFSNSVQSVVIVTSDKCYQNNEVDRGYNENDPMGGKDPYSASKGCSELIAYSYFHSFFNSKDSCKIASARAGNVIGGGDWAQYRIVPDFFRSIMNNESILLRNPNSIRPWQHVLEPLSGYLALCSRMYLQTVDNGQGWNFGPAINNDVTVVNLIEKMITLSGVGKYHLEENFNKPYEAKLLKLDITKAKDILGWQPVLSLDETIEYTVNGYMAELNNEDLLKNRITQIEDYSNLAKQKNIEWAGKL